MVRPAKAFTAEQASEKDLEIITLNKSSVGNSMPKLRKLFVLDSKSINSKLISVIGKIEFITIMNNAIGTETDPFER